MGRKYNRLAAVNAFTVVLLCLPSRVLCQTGDNNVVVRNGFEMHASLTSPQITHIYLASNVAFSIDTCPLPAAEAFSATMITRNLSISSLTPEAAGATSIPQQQPQQGSAASAAVLAGVPFRMDCRYLTDRFEIQPGYQVTFSNVVLVNCRTYSTVGFFRKKPGASLVLDHVVDNRGTVCLPLQQMQQEYQKQQQEQSDVQLTPPGSNWCTGAGGAPGALQGFEAPQLTNTSSALCQQQALLLGRLSIQESPTYFANGTLGPPFSLAATNTVILCPEPISQDCIGSRGAAVCLAAAFDAVNPDKNAPCPALDAYSLLSCLQTEHYQRIILVQSAFMTLETSPALKEPIPITRNVTIMSDPRGPRLNWDCGLLSNRFQLQPNLTLTLQHIILTNCSSTRLLSFIRTTAGSRVVLNDTFVVQPPGLCLPLTERPPGTGGLGAGVIDLHAARPAGIPGLQSTAPSPGPGGSWCTQNDSSVEQVDAETGPAHNTSYSAIGVSVNNLGVFANTTGLGPKYAATIASPARVPFYVHPTWPGNEICILQPGPPPILLRDFAQAKPLGWVAGPSPQQQQQIPRFGSDLNQFNGSFNGTTELWYINTAMLCPEPDITLPNVTAGCTNAFQSPQCAAAIYAAVDPDRQMVPGAAAYEAAAVGASSGGSGGNHGVQVVLPAVLASVGGAAILAGLLAAFIIRRRRHKNRMAAAVAKQSDTYQLDPQQHPDHQQWHQQQQHGAGGPLAWLGIALGGGTPSPAGSDPARGLLGIHNVTPNTGTSGDPARTPGSGGRSGLSPHGQAAPDGIELGLLLGAGSFGRVYSGTWNGMPVAVKVITHSSKDDDRIGRELALSLSFDHPNLVRALHFTKIRINNATPTNPHPGSDPSLLPQGAVGVFSMQGLPTDWAVVQHATATGQEGAPTIDTETWIVMDLMDRGNLAAALRHSNIFVNKSGMTNMARLLRRAADVAAGVSYLHSRNVCHGDLKWENVLLKTEPQDPDGVMAKVADFGLSRALAYGQSHLSTRRYGTVTHMPPELLVAGKLTPAADVYSFGIMMWELVSRSPPFQGLHHGEIIHKVVTADLRPGPWPIPSLTLPLPDGYIPLATSCWARQATSRPVMPKVLETLLQMLAEVQGPVVV